MPGTQESIWEVGKVYSLRLKQMGEHGKNPYVRATSSYLPNGKVKHETINQHGHFMALTFPEYAGLFLFKIEAVNGEHISAVLYIIL
jgi:hypothetical protein